MPPSTPAYGPADIVSVTYGETTDRNVVNAFLFTQCRNRLEANMMIALTSSLGDCTEVMTAQAMVRIGEETREVIAGLCTLAVSGEQGSGYPTVVGCGVDPSLRGAKEWRIGTGLLERGIARMRVLIAERSARIARLREEFGDQAADLLAELELKSDRIRIEAVTTEGKKVSERLLYGRVLSAQEKGIAVPEPYADVDYHDFSLPMPPMPLRFAEPDGG